MVLVPVLVEVARLGDLVTQYLVNGQRMIEEIQGAEEVACRYEAEMPFDLTLPVARPRERDLVDLFPKMVG